MKDCISHTGNYDDWDNPLDEVGNPYLPGERSCKHRDCVNTKHIVGYARANSYILPDGRRCNEMYSLEVIEQVIRLGSMPRGKELLCMVEGCGKLHRTRNLCSPHYGLFRRKKNEELRKQERLTLADFPELPKPTPRNQRREPNYKAECLMDRCNRISSKRGICKQHSQMFYKLRKATK